MVITVNTDASYSNKFKVGTYAFWIISNKGKFFRSGKLKGTVFSAMHAEMKCIINALHLVFDNTELNRVNKILINTDCLFAIEKFGEPYKKWVSSKRPALIKESEKIRSRFLDLFNDYFSEKPSKRKIQIKFRHLKSHEHTDDSRHYLNDMCDKEAKVQMGIILRKLNKRINK